MVRILAQELGFSATGQTMLVTAASELARNAIVYGGGGVMLWGVRREGLKVGLRLTFEDHGPGIPDVGLAMTAGWTSERGMGLGLTGAKRLAHQFSIDSEVGVGTRITVTRWK
jgi:serine/threonine-protein kinase RsbT